MGQVDRWQQSPDLRITCLGTRVELWLNFPKKDEHTEIILVSISFSMYLGWHKVCKSNKVTMSSSIHQWQSGRRIVLFLSCVFRAFHNLSKQTFWNKASLHCTPPQQVCWVSPAVGTCLVSIRQGPHFILGQTQNPVGVWWWQLLYIIMLDYKRITWPLGFLESKLSHIFEIL